MTWERVTQSLDCTNDDKLENNSEDQYSHRKILQNGKLDVIKDFKEQFNERIYLRAQRQLLQHGTKKIVDEVLEVNQGSHDLFNNTFFEVETLIIILQNSRTDKQCIEGMWWNRNKNMKCTEQYIVLTMH